MATKYDYNLSVFENEDAISYYLLGAFITDGCVYLSGKNRYACQLSSIDSDWLRSIADVVGNNLNLHNFRKNYYGIRIIRDNISRWFINHGCKPRKTYDVVLPDIPDQYFNSFLLGCIDGDGSLGTYYFNNNSNRRCSLISASKIFLTAIKEKLSIKGIKSSITNRGMQSSIVNSKLVKATVNSYSLNTYGTNCYKLLKYIYSVNLSICLKRKQIRAKEIMDYYESLPGDLKKIPIRHYKIIWPDDETLVKMIKESNRNQVAKKLGIGYPSLMKRLRRHNLLPLICPTNDFALQAGPTLSKP